MKRKTNLWIELSGKKINSISICCHGNENDFANSENLQATISNAIILKRFGRLIICTYNLRDRQTLFDSKITDDFAICQASKKNFYVALKDENDLFWSLNLTLA